MSIFSKSNLPESDLKRNTFDLSFQNNLTTNFGVLKPVFCKEVIPGDTFDIDVTFGLRFMPTVFPIQNRARASVKFFYVRKRSLYEDFKEWSTGNDANLSGLPYLDFTTGAGTSTGMFKDRSDCLEFFKYGGLADSLGIPVSRTVPRGTEFSSLYTFSDSVTGTLRGFNVHVPCTAANYKTLTLDDLPKSEFSLGLNSYTRRPVRISPDYGYCVIPPTATARTFADGFSDAYSSYLLSNILELNPEQVSKPDIRGLLAQNSGLTLDISFNAAYQGLGDPGSSGYPSYSALLEDTPGKILKPIFQQACLDPDQDIAVYPVIYASCDSNLGISAMAGHNLNILAIGERFEYSGEVEHISSITIPSDVDWFNLPPMEDANGFPNFDQRPHFGLLIVTPPSLALTSPNRASNLTFNSFNVSTPIASGDIYGTTLYHSTVETQPIGPLFWQYIDDPASIPFLWGTGLSSLPFRAYELVYNAFYRDERNNPFQINGVSYYDKFLPTMQGGKDTTLYKLRHVNWEQDQFTTALPSPQQGAAPLVGISSTGRATLMDTDGTPVEVQLETAEDGDTVVSYSQTSDLSPAVQRTLVNAATSGISINDFRAVNALQRYLEKNLRQGLRYKDMIQSRWGVSPSYSELNMPEFIGGVVEDVIPSQVNNNNGSDTSEPLGSYAGQLYCQGSSKHTIHKFCDEPGYIIGILDVTPVPVYNSLLPKHFKKFDVLDFYNPEFGHIGYQPVQLGELACNSLWDSRRSPDETFGYQRAWYDYLCSNDEVHGDFRGSLRDFVIYRDFVNPPTLSEEFLTVSDKETNNVFSVQTDADGNEIDKILGQIYFDVKAKRPIPRFGIPRLE